MQKPPGHGAHLIEEVDGDPGAPEIDRSRPGQQPEVGVDLHNPDISPRELLRRPICPPWRRFSGRGACDVVRDYASAPHPFESPP